MRVVKQEAGKKLMTHKCLREPKTNTNFPTSTIPHVEKIDFTFLKIYISKCLRDTKTNTNFPNSNKHTDVHLHLRGKQMNLRFISEFFSTSGREEQVEGFCDSQKQ